MSEPAELAEAKLILGLCDRWHKTPPEIYALDASVLRLLKIESLGIRREEVVPDAQ